MGQSRLRSATSSAPVGSASVAVPSDLAIVGLDDDPLSGLHLPSRTTVRFDYAWPTDVIHQRVVVAYRGRTARDDDVVTPPESAVVLVPRDTA